MTPSPHVQGAQPPDLCMQHGDALCKLNREINEFATNTRMMQWDITKVRDDLEDLREDVTDVKQILTRLDTFVRNPETYDEMRRQHLDYMAVSRHKDESRNILTRWISVAAMTVSGVVGVIAILREVMK